MLARSVDLRDEVLVARHRVGDDCAFETITARHRRALVRHAERVLGVHRSNADDVVQEALMRAHRALRRDDREIRLEPWLHRLVRNCALDELARLNSGPVSLESIEEPEARGSDPGVIFNRRARLRRLLADIAALPSQQRHVLLRRELDGATHEELARELGTTVAATRGLVFRARSNLTKAGQAAEAACEFVRADLVRAHDERRRASSHSYRHLGSCAACSAFRDSLADGRRAMRLLSPAPFIFAGLGLGFGAASHKTAAVVGATAALAGGVAGVQVLRAGDPVPVRVVSAALAPGGLVAGEALPGGTALVSGRAERSGEVALECPSGTRVAALVPPERATAAMGFMPATVPGVDRIARVRVGAAGTDVRVLCKAPDATGSVLFGALPGRARVCARHAYLHASRGGGTIGSVRQGQPVRLLSREGGWREIRTDGGVRGWVRSPAVC